MNLFSGIFNAGQGSPAAAGRHGERALVVSCTRIVSTLAHTSVLSVLFIEASCFFVKIKTESLYLSPLFVLQTACSSWYQENTLNRLHNFYTIAVFAVSRNEFLWCIIIKLIKAFKLTRWKLFTALARASAYCIRRNRFNRMFDVIHEFIFFVKQFCVFFSHRATKSAQGNI